MIGLVAQLVERRIRIAEVGGSIPLKSTIKKLSSLGTAFLFIAMYSPCQRL